MRITQGGAFSELSDHRRAVRPLTPIQRANPLALNSCGGRAASNATVYAR
jgi:hypothetical protein